MKESYREGVATHPGPEPCEGGRKDALEALERGICRLGYRASKWTFQDADDVGSSEGETASHVNYASGQSILRSRRT